METFVILNEFPYETTLNTKDFRKIRNLCVKYDLHDRYLPVFEGSFYKKKYRQIGVIDLLYIKYDCLCNTTIPSEKCQYPDDFIDVDVVEDINDVRIPRKVLTH